MLCPAPPIPPNLPSLPQPTSRFTAPAVASDPAYLANLASLESLQGAPPGSQHSRPSSPRKAQTRLAPQRDSPTTVTLPTVSQDAGEEEASPRFATYYDSFEENADAAHKAVEDTSRNTPFPRDPIKFGNLEESSTVPISVRQTALLSTHDLIPDPHRCPQPEPLQAAPPTARGFDTSAFGFWMMRKRHAAREAAGLSASPEYAGLATATPRSAGRRRGGGESSAQKRKRQNEDRELRIAERNRVKFGL